MIGEDASHIAKAHVLLKIGFINCYILHQLVSELCVQIDAEQMNAFSKLL